MRGDGRRRSGADPVTTSFSQVNLFPSSSSGVTAMLANYAQIIRRSAVATAVVGGVMVVLSTLAGGGKGFVGSVLGIALVAAFFGISVVAVGRAARVSPRAMMITAIATYLAKILALLFFVVRFSSTTAFNGKLFGLTALACILAWTFSQVLWASRLKVAYVEPAPRRQTVPDIQPDGER
jgi:ATP synthase protein I